MSHHQRLLDSLRQAGHRLTPQREMILAIIGESQTHLTAKAILQRVRARYPHINKSAIYRTLDLLTRLGLVNPTDLGHGQIEYEIRQRPFHHHLICHNCGKITRVDESLFASLDRKLRDEYGFAADLCHFAIFGLCAKCQARTTPTRTRRTK